LNKPRLRHIRKIAGAAKVGVVGIAAVIKRGRKEVSVGVGDGVPVKVVGFLGINKLCSHRLNIRQLTQTITNVFVGIILIHDGELLDSGLWIATVDIRQGISPQQLLRPIRRPRAIRQLQQTSQGVVGTLSQGDVTG
jgi:hypothetical protein